MAWARSRAWRLKVPACWTWVSQPPDSAKAISSPTSDLISRAICFRALPSCYFGYSAPAAGLYRAISPAESMWMARKVSLPVSRSRCWEVWS